MLGLLAGLGYLAALSAQQTPTGNQMVTARLHWLADSMLLGAPTQVALVIERPDTLRVQVQDSARSFRPYELQHRARHTIPLGSGRTRDSLVYTLLSFEIDSLQQIRIPYRYILDQTLHTAQSPIDSIPFASRVPAPATGRPFRLLADLAPISRPAAGGPVWYVFAAAGLGLALLIVLARPAWLLWRRYRIRRAWQRVARGIPPFQSPYELPPGSLREVNDLWKYWLSARTAPDRLQSLTTPELETCLEPAFEPEARRVLLQLARAEDRLFYAGKTTPDRADTPQPTSRQLLDILRGEVRKRLAEVK